MAFAGFDARRISVGEVELFVRVGGSGTPLLLLHGYPQTHMIWHAVAPLLADRFHVLCAGAQYEFTRRPVGANHTHQ